MLSGKDFVSRNLFGERFDKNIYRNGFDLHHAKKGLTPTGKNVIEKFILQNHNKAEMMKQREDELFRAFHSIFRKFKCIIKAKVEIDHAKLSDTFIFNIL